MENSHLCPNCGEKTLESEKYCSKCGAVNYHNSEIIARAISENAKYYGKTKKAVRIIRTLKTIGIILMAFSVLVDVIFAFSIAFGGDVYDIIKILPISGITFIAGLTMVFVLKSN